MGREGGLDSQVRPESVEISPVRPSYASEKRITHLGAGERMWIDWGREMYNSKFDEGDIQGPCTYFTAPKGKLHRDVTAE